MPKNLVIVESPAKAKTIEGYLGKDYLVKSSYGHVRDLPKGNGAVDIERGFEPKYEITADKKSVVSELKKLAKAAETIWLATDDDREGEAISWHLKEALSLNDKATRRIVFREITKNAITNAIGSPREIDEDLVNAQQARRVLDRLVGFELSPVLWKKIKGGLSAGRVQSVAVRIVVEREREIDKFTPEAAYKVQAVFALEGGKELHAELPKRFKTEEEANSFLEACRTAKFQIADLETKPRSRKPAAPFTTSTLQQEASRKLGYSVSRTMALAQRLYEEGKITYMRTDSVNLSEEAIENAASAIEKGYGAEYVQRRQHRSTSKSAQEAHEAIRPTRFEHAHVGGERDQQRLYELIWKRAIASQMANAQLEKTVATISVSNRDEDFQATGEVIKFDGFLKVYIESTDDDDDSEDSKEAKGMLPPLTVGQELLYKRIAATQRFSRHPARYTEASLVKQLEKMGIGRPSTYAPTISTIQKRGYVEKDSRDGKPRQYVELSLEQEKSDQGVQRAELSENFGVEKNKLFPTNIAMIVNDFLVEHFPNVIDFNFTANVEELFDKIANGRYDWRQMLDEFYSDFHPKVESVENIDRREVNSNRLLGHDPQTGKPVIARLGRYGAFVRIGDEEDEDKKTASLRHGQFIESITLEEALELFKLPRDLGEFEGKKVVASVGRFGPYVRHDSKFVSLGKERDPHTVDLDTAIELILAKREADAKKLIKTFEQDEDLKILNGRWGPYISYGKQNVRIPKEKKDQAADLTYEECVELIENAPEKGKKKGGPKKEAASKTAAKKKAPAKKATPKKKPTTTAKKNAPAKKKSPSTKKTSA